MDEEDKKRERREHMLGVVIGVPLILFVAAYELFGWLPPIPEGIRSGLSIEFQTAFALVVSAVLAAWGYFALQWLKPAWLRILIIVSAALYIGFDATFHPGVSQDMIDSGCRPAGPGIYNDC